MKRLIIIGILIIILFLALTPNGVTAVRDGLRDHIRTHQKGTENPLLVKPDFTNFNKFQSCQNSLLFDDRQVNLIAGENRFDHNHPFMVEMESGSIIIGWEDKRNATLDIFTQAVTSDGLLSGANQQLVNDVMLIDQMMAKAAHSSDGEIAVVWVDESGDLFLQYFDNDMQSVSEQMQVNDNSTANIVSYPSLSFTSDDQLIIVWEDTRLGSAIYGQIYNASGEAVGDNFIISSAVENTSYWLPYIASDTEGGFAIIYEEISSTGSDVIFQLFDSDGSISGSSVNVADMDAITANQFDPYIIYTSQAGYVVGFSDDRGDDQDIYAQIFALNGNRIDSNFTLSQGDENYAFNIKMAASTSGNILVVWTNIGDRLEIIARKLNSDAELDGDEYSVSDALATGERYSPLVIVRDDGSGVVAFIDSRDESLQIYAQNLDTDWTRDGMNYRVSSTSTGSQMSGSDIATLASGDFVVIWTDCRSDDGDIYLQRLNEFGTKLGSNLLVNDDETIAIQNRSAIGSAENGRTAVCWVDSRQTGGLSGVNIFAQRFSSSGDKIGSNILVNDDPIGSSNVQSDPDCDMTASGEMVVTWRDNRNGQEDIYCQVYSTPGFPAGDNLRINQYDYPCSNPHIGVIGSDKFVVAFNTLINDKSYVMMQVVNLDGSLSGDNLMIPVDSAVNQQLDFDLAVHPTSDAILLAWINKTNEDSEIYSVMLKTDGTLASDLKIISSHPNFSFDHIRVSIDTDGYYAITWTDQRTGFVRAYQAYVNSDGVVIGNNYVSRYAGDTRDLCPSVAMDGKNAIFAWCDNRNLGNGYDVFVNSTVYNPTAVDDDTDLPLPLSIDLSQNYPNPFNPSTTINFNLEREYPQVELQIFNMLGQAVNRVTYENLPAGEYSYEFNASGLSSGIYFYRLMADEISVTKKMTLLK